MVYGLWFGVYCLVIRVGGAWFVIYNVLRVWHCAYGVRVYGLGFMDNVYGL